MKASPITRRRAQTLRRELTKAERILWSKLKGRQLSGRMFRVQHPIGPYIADFACVQLRLVVEVDGETHSSVLERRHDAQRTAFIENGGWSILRVWNSDVYENLEGVLRMIEERLPPRE